MRPPGQEAPEPGTDLCLEVDMKPVILSADGDSVVYTVPDAVADNLEAYCMEFCCG